MNIFELIFRRQQKNSAAVAKERLQIIVSHERSSKAGRDFLPLLQQEIIDVIAKYFTGIDKNSVRVELQRMGSCSVLELNVALPEQAEETA
ncbi:MAG: cell division topological specificity factor MinE [Candidatus Paceibacterales bacterium]